MKGKAKSSSSGETSAINGYMKQYEYSASIIYRLMQDGHLEAISVSEPSAGIFDDLVIHTQNRILAIQVKTQQDATYVALATEFKGSLIKAMAGSWLGLQKKFETEAVSLRYIFSGLLSTSDTALAKSGSSGARHSAEFARFVSRNDLTVEMIAASLWQNALAALQTRSELDADLFVRFLLDLELKDQSELLANATNSFQPADREKVEAIRNLLPQLIKTSTPGQKWTEQDLIKKLGWRSRLSQHNTHIFPVLSDYQENEATERKLLDLIDRTTQGYIALVGPPGTGKSTLLQRGLLPKHNYSVSRYLAFHPDQRHGLGRAEAGEFLNEVIAELRNQGIYASKFASSDLSGSRAEFAQQLNAASERFAKSKHKTVIVIDGLDHVPREENPVVSFLSELPASKAVPEGVIIVLGTQRMDLPGLHPTIIQQSKEPDRTIEIDPLTKAAVFALANAANVPSFVSREAISEKCDGHPLSARYFIEALKLVSTADEAEQILSDADGLGQSLEQIYERVWQKLTTAKSSDVALALLARAEGTLSCEQLAKESSDEAVEDVLVKAGFLLSRTAGGRLSIFHNSFRLFIARETGKKFGQANPSLEADFHARLAAIASDASDDDPQHWLQLRYRSRAADLEGVRKLGEPTYFRRSLRVFRPIAQIYTDLRLTYGAVLPTRNRTLLLNKLLVEKEVDYRIEAVSNLDFVSLLMNLGDIELATQHALNTGESTDGWLALVDYYWSKGETERARQVFGANEPLEIIFSEKGFDTQQQLKNAQNWVQRAQRFRSVAKLSAMIDSIVVNTRSLVGEDDGSSTRNRLKFNLALGAVNDARIADFRDLKRQLALTDSEIACLAIAAAERAHEAGEADEASAYLKNTNIAEIVEAHPSWRRAAAMLARRMGKVDFARSVATTLSIPRFDRSTMAQIEMDDLFREIVETSFLAAALDLEIEEEATEERDEPSLLATTHPKVREIGSLRWLAKRQDAALTAKALKTIILFFAHAKPEINDFSSYRFFNSLGSIANHFVQIAHDAGEGCFKDIVTFIDSKVDAGDNNLSASNPFRLNFATEVFQFDRESNRAIARVEATRFGNFVGRTPHEAVEDYVACAKAYCRVGAISQARATLDAMHNDTFGYWLQAKKEPQYAFWAWSFLKACNADPQNMTNAALVFAQFILGMDETEGDGTAARLVANLLDGAAVSPRAAAGIAERLLNSNLSNWSTTCNAALASVAKHDKALAPMVLVACSCIVMPYASGDIDRSLTACLGAMSPKEREKPIDMLVEDIRRWCPPSNREVILKRVAELAPEVEEKLKALITDAASITEKLHRVTHGDPREKSSDAGVLIDIKVKTLAELIAHGEGKTSYGNGVDHAYARAAAKIADNSSKIQMESFLKQRSHVEIDAKTMVSFARRLLHLGHLTDALNYFRKAETAATSGYWSTFFGGEKLAVQKLRIELEGKTAVETGFDILLQELASGQTNGSSLFLNLEDVLELVTDQVPFVEFWAEVQAHLMQYREFRLAAPVVAIDTVTTHSDLLAFIVAQGFNLSCPEVLQHARRAADLIARGSTDSSFIEKLCHFVEEFPEGRREIAALLHSLTELPQLETHLRNKAKVGVNCDDFVVAQLYKHILHEIAEPFEKTPSVELPAFYQLLPSGTAEAENFDAPPGLNPGQRPVWSDDPWTWTSMLPGAFHMLSKASGISLELLRRRCAHFMQIEGGRAAFGPEVEDAIVRKLRRLQLQFSYNRPMPVSYLRAMGKVIQELHLANAVDPKVFGVIWDELGGPIFSNFAIHVEAKPDWLAYPEMPRRHYGGIDEKQWLEQTDEFVYSSLEPEKFVLAEETYFSLQAVRSSAEVTRTSLPRSADPINNIEQLPKLFSYDYFRPMYRKTESRLVCRIPRNLFGNLKSDTMTICPHLAKDLGWEASAFNPLELLDSTGALVAKTIRWVDGTHVKTRYDAEIYGVGQVVLLTRAGKAQLEANGVKITLGMKVTANIEGENGDVQEREILAGM